jgi:DNA-binding GntR family transcriptional regulator
MRSLDQLFQYASDTRFIINDVKFAIPENTMLSDVGGDIAEWLIVHGLRLERDKDIPICFSIVLVNRDYASIAEELETGSGSTYKMIEDKFDIKVSQVIQDITITTMPQRAALFLDKTALDVAVKVRRRYLLADDTIFLVSVNQHPADEFSYTMQLHRERKN